ncbi:hypothetical protein ERICI_02672 [Paenibacillus larvae subsp. larvae]|uniref:Uncharacterized protein n=2 Tax=Paenibacillus larvae subsp. larvae TaxID=147375 RepID=V9W6X9_9BACL|nr:hypothetical protein ERIC2_c21061 [Paenibacillus larvae subsp. larvae DSM 25430]AVF22485.1 hypothetical protein ERICI_02672 [Paenibacillus larvae subsp. larvae]ETK26667.1 hypothetical protein ERIC1_1c00940 [Paenibacillus larvae subsp. larvae DSM 25719]AVF26818.1 hypothetical protein ERICIII_02682 [Paenibacillus larvae subsp. larvae]AVF31567.1 hypothetical protein ERICIV_02673 [Paenibacillus larvae subsp. larvae]
MAILQNSVEKPYIFLLFPSILQVYVDGKGAR